ncbi:MAG: 3-hydroxyacyl-CoA dehydrogenase [Proteobacteria bacterium]|nr:3-hydroxyacyl-CoA dehydrogenase [Pseudomonadota bacterium]MDA1332107.1 3-hydroxyacyl-CoA dehydrogenase [Pseudomonadota bacterium]
MKNIAIIGSGLIGRAWSIVFARANYPVMLYDNANGAVRQAIELIGHGLADLKKYGLIDEDPITILSRITHAQSLEEAVSKADYVQENTSENLDIKKEVFSTLDQLAPDHCILASSTSTIQTSLFSEHLKGRHRCLVAHPVNPPHIVPIVEISPAQWTSPEVTQKTYDLHQQVGQVPIIVKKEVAGFVLNRLQAALLREAWRLVQEDYVSVEDLDKTMKDGLGLRWAFMGPFETIDLNAPGGIADYAVRFGGAYSEMMSNINYPNWTVELVKKVESERRKIMPFSEHHERESWRDQHLMALIAHKRNNKLHN